MQAWRRCPKSFPSDCIAFCLPFPLCLADDMFLNGTLPSEIAHLSSLRSISLTRNELTGPLPSELGALSRLAFLELEQNSLTGSIPSCLFDASVGPAAGSLLHLDLSFNQLSPSSIPVEIQSMSNLEHLFLNAAKIVGPLPFELFQLTRLSTSWIVQRMSRVGVVGFCYRMILVSSLLTYISSVLLNEIRLVPFRRERDNRDPTHGSWTTLEFDYVFVSVQ